MLFGVLKATEIGSMDTFLVNGDFQRMRKLDSASLILNGTNQFGAEFVFTIKRGIVVENNTADCANRGTFNTFVTGTVTWHTINAEIRRHTHVTDSEAGNPSGGSNKALQGSC